MASALKTRAGAAIRATARRAWVMAWTSGWFWQLVPMRLTMKAIASRRRHSTPRFASHRMRSANSQRTSGFCQFRSHCQWLKVVHTQASAAGSKVKLPGAKSGNTSGRLCSYASGTVRSGNRWK